MSDINNLKKIIPPDQAVANKAMARSLQQVKRIFGTTSEELAAAVTTLETTAGLPLIANLTTPVPQSVVNVYQNNVGNGTGAGGAITLDDIIGTAAGVVHNDELPVAANVVTQLQSSGALDSLTANAGPSSSASGAYTIMQYLLQGTYTGSLDPDNPLAFVVTIPAGVAGSGSYGPGSRLQVQSDAMLAVINAANVRINNIVASNANLVTRANQAYTAMAQELQLNKENQAKAGIRFAELEANNQSAVLSVITNLHDLGTQDSRGGAASFLENTANLATLSGQAVVASMREGRNINKMNDVGLLLDTQITVGADQPAANLLPS